MSRLALALALVVLGTSPASAEEEREHETRESYVGTMVLTDLAILTTAIPVIAASDGHEAETAGLYLLAYLASGPILHAAHGNDRQAGRSFAKRLLLPVGVAAAAAMFGAVGEADCTGEFCGLATIGLGILGAGVGVISAVISDWTTAHVEVGSTSIRPSVSADAQRVSVGVGGAF